MRPISQFLAELFFHFREHGTDRLRKFVFPKNLHRRIPVRMDGVDGFNKVGMWTDAAAEFEKDDLAVVQCVVIAPELFIDVVRPGVKFELWDGGFFASGKVIERVEAGWRRP